MAEGEGFEPPESFRPQTISSRPLSTTQPPLRNDGPVILPSEDSPCKPPEIVVIKDMFFIIPIGRNAVLTKFPWTTVLLIVVNALVFTLTWPDEKKFLISRSPDSPLVTYAYRLADEALRPESRLPADK